STNLATKYTEINLVKKKKEKNKEFFPRKTKDYWQTKTINQNFNPGKGTADQSAVPLYNHVIFRIVAATRAIAAMTSHISVIFHTNLTHLIYGIPETASTPISDADVGMIVFVIASPYWYARTATCLGIS